MFADVVGGVCTMGHDCGNRLVHPISTPSGGISIVGSLSGDTRAYGRKESTSERHAYLDYLKWPARQVAVDRIRVLLRRSIRSSFLQDQHDRSP
jgi:hypothetical protein